MTTTTAPAADRTQGRRAAVVELALMIESQANGIAFGLDTETPARIFENPALLHAIAADLTKAGKLLVGIENRLARLGGERGADR